MPEAAIKRLGTFLADLTLDKPPDQIHQAILDRLRDSDQELDHRLAGIYLHGKDFLPIWTAIRNGVSLPATSWETVVLPVVVHFSSAQNLKTNLETVTNLFLDAQGARGLETEPLPSAEPPLESEPPPPLLLDELFGAPPQPTPEPLVVAKTRRRWVPQAAAVTIVAIVAVLIWNGRDDNGGGGTAFSGLPRSPVVTVPSPSLDVSPSASGSPDVPPSVSPTHVTTPVPGQPGNPSVPSRIPGAPTGLISPKQDRTSVTLSWTAPRDTTNVAYYRVFQDGVAKGQTTGTTDTVLSLTPGTTYTFTIRAFNSSGEQSPPSNSLSIRTAGPPQSTFDVPTSVAFGRSFNVGGSGWSCPSVQIFIAGFLVEQAKVDSYGGFDVQIVVHDNVFGDPGYVDRFASDEEIHLTRGPWAIRAACSGGPDRVATLTVR